MTATVTDHYASSGTGPAWTSNLTGETSRNIPGIDGQLAAIQNGSEAPVLQLANLHGDVIATAYASPTATELASKAGTTEYGVPTTSLPAKYSWLGSLEIPTELPSGIAEMGVRAYVPQLGRFLQPDPIPGGSANAYSYTFGNPLNTSDPSGTYTTNADQADAEYGNERAVAYAEQREQEIREEEERKAAEEAAARAAAERRAQRAAELAALYAGPEYAEEWWEEWWEEEEYEYAADHQGSGNGEQEIRIEPAVLIQPLRSEAGKGEEAATLGSTVPLCSAGSEGPCARLTRGGEGTHKKHNYHHKVVPSGSLCYGIAAATTIGGPELAIPRVVGYAIFGVCGG